MTSWTEKIYEQVGLEIMNNQFDPTALERANEEARGDTALAKSLYLKYRIEQLDVEQKLKEAQALEHKRDQVSLAALALTEALNTKKTLIDHACGRCIYRGKMNYKSEAWPKIVLHTSMIAMALSFILYAITTKLIDWLGMIFLQLFTLSFISFFIGVLFSAHAVVCPQCGFVLRKVSSPQADLLSQSKSLEKNN